MLKEPFLGLKPSHYQMNSLVKSFIASEVLIWSAWNSAMSIIAIFAATKLVGGNIEIAATALSVHLMVRVGAELFTSRVLSRINESRKFLIIISGITIISVSFIGFAVTNSTGYFFIFYALAGVGLGIATPLKNSLFSTHLDKNKEASEWSIYDAMVFIGMAASAAIGGVVAKNYGFQTLFLIAAAVNLMGIIPYYLYAQKRLVKLIFGKKKIELELNLTIEDSKVPKS